MLQRAIALLHKGSRPQKKNWVVKESEKALEAKFKPTQLLSSLIKIERQKKAAVRWQRR